MSKLNKYNEIKISELNKLQEIYQKEPSTFIHLFLSESSKKWDSLQKACKWAQLGTVAKLAKDLRLSSIDVGAIQLSCLFLQIEIAAQESRHQDVQAYIERSSPKYLNMSEELKTYLSEITRPYVPMRTDA